MKKNCIAMFALLFLGTGLFAQTLSTASNGLNGPATEFGKSMVKAYFTNQCSLVYNALAVEIMNMENGQKLQKSDFSQQDFCAESPLRNDIKGVTYTAYLQNYTPVVLNDVEFAQQHPQLQQIYNLQPGDFYFNGANLNKGATELFKAADMVTFILRKVPKTTNQYQIIGM